jgi:aryl-alcohol dehydrogenase-like predicted oxidoreductase
VQYRRLGKSDLKVPVISFGAGPISGLMVGDDTSTQLETISRAVDFGIDYFDTAATYGAGRSESALGAVLKTLNVVDRVRLATKVRLMPEQLNDVGVAVRASFESSCRRLGVDRVTLLQLHNSITSNRGDLPTSLTVHDVLGRKGVVAEFEKLKQAGRVAHFGFTGLGDMDSLVTIVKEGPFIAAQIPLNILLPIGGRDATAGSIDVDYLQLARICHEYGVGVIAIRVFAGGALVGQEPSSHTYKTKFFTLDVFERDRIRASELAKLVPKDIPCTAATIRYVTGILNAATALIGFATPDQVEEAVAFSEDGPLEESLMKKIHDLAVQLKKRD